MKKYKMTKKERDELVYVASQPVMYLSGGTPMFDHQKENQVVWEKMGKKYGFDWETAIPLENGKTNLEFLATPLEKQTNK